MAFVKTFNPMDVAEKKGAERIASDVYSQVERGQAESQGELEKYGEQKQLTAVGSNIASQLLTPLLMKGGAKLLKGLLGGATGGLSTLIPDEFITSSIGQLLGQGLKAGISGAVSGGVGRGISDVVGTRIGTPTSPTADTSMMTGPYMSGYKKTIADKIAMGDVAYQQGMGGIQDQLKQLNLIMSLGPELTKKQFGTQLDPGQDVKLVSISDYLKELLGTDIMPNLKPAI